MCRAQVYAEEVEVVVLLEAGVDVGWIIYSRRRGGNIGQDGGAVEIPRPKRTSIPSSTVLRQVSANRRSGCGMYGTWQRNIALTWVLLTVEEGSSVTVGPAYAVGST